MLSNNDKNKKIINAVVLSVAIISLAENFRLGIAQSNKTSSDNLPIESIAVEEVTKEEKWNSFLDSNHYLMNFYGLQELPIEKITYTKDEIENLITIGKCYKIDESDYWINANIEAKEGTTNLIYVRYESAFDKYFGIGIKSLKNEDLDVFLINNSNMKGGNQSYTIKEIEAFLLAGKATFDESEKCYYINVGSGFKEDNIYHTVPVGYSIMLKYVYDENTKTYVKTCTYHQIKDSKGIERTRRK